MRWPALLLLLAAPALAGPIAVATDARTGQSVTLHDEAGHCSRGLLAIWRSGDSLRAVRGCWELVGDGDEAVVLLRYVDGDTGSVRRAHFRRPPDS